VTTSFPAPPAPEGITAGPDGSLWIPLQLGVITRLTTSGSRTDFPLPNNNALPSGITSGPDGNLWFTEYVGNKIARITTAGVITEYAVPTSGSYPFGITTGPDGNLWFTEIGSRIGRLNPNALPAPVPLPASILFTVLGVMLAALFSFFSARRAASKVRQA